MKSPFLRHGFTWGAILAAAFGSTVESAEASGFAIREQSTTAQGTSFASAPTGVEDISFSFFNPASLTFHDGQQVAVSASYISPNSEFKGGEASTAFGTPITPTVQFDGDDEIGQDAAVPSFYGMVSLTDDLKLGLAISAPFGLETDNADGWIGRYHALESELLTVDVNPMLAFRPMPGVSIGGGPRFLYANATLNNAIDQGTIGARFGIPGARPTQEDGFAELEGDDFGLGGSAGLMIEPGAFAPALEGLRFGVGYRSHVDFNIAGDTEFDTRGSSTGTALQLAGLNRDTDATADLELPESVSFGLHYDVSQEWAVMGQAEWTNWSRFDELRIQFDNPAQQDSVTDQSWDDSWFFSLGTVYRPDLVEGLSVRLGLAYDESPVPDATRTPRIPDEDRYWISFGLGYEPTEWFSVDFAYTHIFLPDADIDLKASDEGNAFRGNFSGSYDTEIDIISIQARLRF